MRLRGLLLVLVGVVVLGLPAGAQAEAGCPNEVLRQGLSANLPDCRAYEMVSPPYKEGSSPFLKAVSPDGSHAIVRSIGNFGDDQNNVFAQDYYEFTRGASGWSETAALDPPASVFPYDALLDATPDLSKTLFKLRSASQSVLNLDAWVRDRDGAMHDLGPILPPAQTTGPSGSGVPEGSATGIHYRGASQDLSKVFFGLQAAYWPGDGTVFPDESLYQYPAGQDGSPLLVGVDDAGHLIGACGVFAGPAGGAGEAGAQGAVSADGSVVLFTVIGEDDSNCGASQPPVDEIFARIDGGQAGAHTLAISQPTPNAECTTVACQGAAPRDAEFQAASADSSKVFFTSTQQLTDTASQDSSAADSATAHNGTGCANTLAAGGCNLYLYDRGSPVGHELNDVSGGDPNPRVQGVLAVSADGSHAYFVAQGALTGAQQGASGAVAAAGAENLYVFESDAAFPAGHVSFIATLSPEDSVEWSAEPGLGIGATATPDGRYLAFTSAADLTPDDTSTVAQAFRYDGLTGELVRVSIGQHGFNDNGNTNRFPVQIPELVKARVMEGALPISSDGSYVVFQSVDGLTPGALNAHPTGNGVTLANNIYEYHAGEVTLLSDGRDATAAGGQSAVSFFGQGGIDSTGRDVFFGTADPLVASDTDTQLDLYDARVDGGFATVSPQSQCQGDACQPLAGLPVEESPGSASVAGPGNLAPSAALTATAARRKTLTRAQKLARALTACRRQPRRRRASCIARAHRLYGLGAVTKTIKRSGRGTK